MDHLKRYSIIYFAFLFISVILISFYVMDEETLDFKWKTVSGDEAVVKDVTILGDGQSSPGMASYYSVVSEPFQLSVDESKRINQSRESYYGWYYSDLQIEKYVKEYKSFMRGKNQWSENFAETDNQLIYVDGNENNWDMNEQNHIGVEILDKETENVSSFELAVEDQQIYGVSSITADNYNKLYVQLYMEGQYDEITDVYTDENGILVIDLNNQTIEDIRFPQRDMESKEGIEPSLTYQDSGLINGEMHYLYTYDEYKVDQNGVYVGDSPLKYELRLYNVEQDSFQSIDLQEANFYGGDFLRIYDGTVYAGMLQGENYTLTKFDENLEEQETVFEENVFDAEIEIGQEEVYPLTDVHNGYFYVVFPAYSTLTVADISINVFDLETGENVYQGIIQAEDSMKQYQYFDLYQMEFEDK
ncbi:hypothetical protein [Oceanobacillus oncorhynchi]|uniref:hypothetical protein n=1 Tax=Oceanobacillus oncorhynchi TaxID=545501 RepID=UPI0018692859|nr:hypothetical protein [Oceanobacillus oncorhynchi]MDM8100241.1 hypothetical protein [Oceanobacillus oncorhynchi]UUI40943.1 hypothetical protein NP440_04970 [Oceanobacillus oncorhynchi]